MVRTRRRKKATRMRKTRGSGRQAALLLAGMNAVGGHHRGKMMHKRSSRKRSSRKRSSRKRSSRKDKRRSRKRSSRKRSSRKDKQSEHKRVTRRRTSRRHIAMPGRTDRRRRRVTCIPVGKKARVCLTGGQRGGYSYFKIGKEIAKLDKNGDHKSTYTITDDGHILEHDLNDHIKKKVNKTFKDMDELKSAVQNTSSIKKSDPSDSEPKAESQPAADGKSDDNERKSHIMNINSKLEKLKPYIKDTSEKNKKIIEQAKEYIKKDYNELSKSQLKKDHDDIDNLYFELQKNVNIHGDLTKYKPHLDNMKTISDQDNLLKIFKEFFDTVYKDNSEDIIKCDEMLLNIFNNTHDNDRQEIQSFLLNKFGEFKTTENKFGKIVYFSNFTDQDIISQYNFAGYSSEDFEDLEFDSDNPDEFKTILLKYNSFTKMLNLIMEKT